VVSSPLEPQVILGADAGQHRDFFATQSLDSSALAAWQTNICGLEQFAAGSQEARQPLGGSHQSRLGPYQGKGDPALTRNDVAWIPGVCGCIVVASE
jgi:hypothetical protein